MWTTMRTQRIIKLLWLLKAAFLFSLGIYFNRRFFLRGKGINLNGHNGIYFSSGNISARHQPKTPCSFNHRQYYVTETCRRLNKSSSFDPNKRHFLNHMITDDKHKILYCYIPKAGCTTWKTVFANYTDKIQEKKKNSDLWSNISRINVHDASVMAQIGLPVLSSPKFTNTDIMDRLKHYLKVIIVRHPFDRLLSAYREKFQKQFYKRPIVEYVARQYANISDTSKGHLKPGMIPFRSFINFIVRDHVNITDEHWGTYMNLCHPCQIHYDVIMKLETMPQDAPYILSKLTGSDANGGAEVIDKFNSFADSHTTLEMFRTLPQDVIAALWNIYEVDFRVFGYGWDKKDSKVICEMEEHNVKCC